VEHIASTYLSGIKNKVMINVIPLVDLKRQHSLLHEEIQAAIESVMNQGDFILGKDLVSFERAFAKYCGINFAIGVASGTDALHLALRAIDIKPGEGVITAPNSFIATALAISFAGATPIFMDIDENTSNITAEGLEEKIVESRNKGINIRAVIPIHLYGNPAPMPEIMAIARKYGLHVIEDACQAHGAGLFINGNFEKVGSFGDIGCFSFFPGKNLGAFGDGGIAVTKNQSLAQKLKLLRNYGSTEKYIHNEKGGNSRLDTLQAAVLNVKLAYLDKWNEQRNQIAISYREAIRKSNSLREKIILPAEPQNRLHVYHLFVIRLKDRDKMLSHLHSKGIMAGIHYPVPIHLQKAYEELNLKRGTFPIAEQLATEILSLPIYPGMRVKEVERVVEEIKNFYK
jgi:dTDP-4-amino-4,6-dideoxygalactose transaminase